MGPVRIGNGAYTQVQNDGYGSVILSIAQVFFDQRLTRMGDASLFERMEKLGAQAAARWNQPDAGPWELRTRIGVHTYSAVMRSEEHTSELQSLMRISYAVFCLKKNT